MFDAFCQGTSGKIPVTFFNIFKNIFDTTFAQLKAFLISMKCIRGKDTRMNIWVVCIINHATYKWKRNVIVL